MLLSENGIDYIKYLNTVRGLGLIDNTNYIDYHGYITAHKDQLKGLYDIYKEGMSFVDLGCGAGNVLLYAHNIGYDVVGVDFNESLLKHVEYKTICADLNKLEPDFYKDFDVIYCFRPLTDENLKPYLNKVIACMKSGSYIMTPTRVQENKNLIEVKGYNSIKKLKL